MNKRFIILFLVAVLIFASSFASAFDYVLGKTFYSLPSATKPAKGLGITDSTFHTTYHRITDAASEANSHMASVVYSRWSPLNSDGTKLYFQRESGWSDAMIYNAISPYPLIEITPEPITIDGVPNQHFVSMESAEIRWDKTGSRPNIFYYVSGMQFLEFDVSTNQAHVIRDFSSDFPGADSIMNDVEGDSSGDSRYWVWMVMSPYDGSTFPIRAIFTYDKQTNTILGTLDYNKYKSMGGKETTLPRPNMVDMSPSGNKIVLLTGMCWGTTSYGNCANDIGTIFDGPHAWSKDFSNPVKVCIDETHSGWGYDKNGNEVFVCQDNRRDYITYTNINTGEQHDIIYHGDLGWNNGFHFARMPSSKTGWILMSTYADLPNTDWGDNQLLMLEIKDESENPRIWRLGHTYNNPNEYYAEAFAAMSQFGDKIWWGAKWSGQNNIEAYEMDLPLTWWEDLGGSPQTFHPADTNQNNIIEMKELIAFIGKWKSSQANINDVMTALDRWFRGA